MPAGARWMACLAVSALAHAVLLGLPSPAPVVWATAAPLEVVLRLPDPGPITASSVPERPTGLDHRGRSSRRAVPVPRSAARPVPALAVVAPGLARQEVPVEGEQSLSPSEASRTPSPELPSGPVSVVVDAAPAEPWNSWRPPRPTDAGQHAAQALAQEIERARNEAQFRAMGIGSMWMDMYQRLSELRPAHEGDCLLLRSSGFRPICQGIALDEWSARLHLQGWAEKLAALDESLQGLRLSASHDGLHLRVLIPSEAAPSPMAVRPSEAQGVDR